MSPAVQLHGSNSANKACRLTCAACSSAALSDGHSFYGLCNPLAGTLLLSAHTTHSCCLPMTDSYIWLRFPSPLCLNTSWFGVCLPLAGSQQEVHRGQDSKILLLSFGIFSWLKEWGAVIIWQAVVNAAVIWRTSSLFNVRLYREQWMCDESHSVKSSGKNDETHEQTQIHLRGE